MKRTLALLTIVGLIFVVGCGGDDKPTDAGCTPGCGCGDGAGDALKDAQKKAGDALKDAGKKLAGTEIAYTCKCGKEKKISADAEPPS